MNSKWKWVIGITRAMIIVLLPLLVWALFLANSEYGIMGLGSLFSVWMIIMALVVFVIFGFSEEG